jgi:hypothetical protein
MPEHGFEGETSLLRNTQWDAKDCWFLIVQGISF